MVFNNKQYYLGETNLLFVETRVIPMLMYGNPTGTALLPFSSCTRQTGNAPFLFVVDTPLYSVRGRFVIYSQNSDLFLPTTMIPQCKR